MTKRNVQGIYLVGV